MNSFQAFNAFRHAARHRTAMGDEFRTWLFGMIYWHQLADITDPHRRFAMALVWSMRDIEPGYFEQWLLMRSPRRWKSWPSGTECGSRHPPAAPARPSSAPGLSFAS